MPFFVGWLKIGSLDRRAVDHLSEGVKAKPLKTISIAVRPSELAVIIDFIKSSLACDMLDYDAGRSPAEVVAVWKTYRRRYVADYARQGRGAEAEYWRRMHDIEARLLGRLVSA